MPYLYPFFFLITKLGRNALAQEVIFMVTLVPEALISCSDPYSQAFLPAAQ